MGILGWHSYSQTILLAYGYIANPCYLNYWRRYININSEPLEMQNLLPTVEYLEEYLTFTTLLDGQVVYRPDAYILVQKQWEAERRSPLLTLLDSDYERGWACLQKLGVPKNAWFVGLHVREPGYHKQYNNSNRDGRNADISTYILAIQSIVNRGGWVIRMGDSTMKPLPPMNQVIDYAHSKAKSDWMDVFLWSQCRFFIGSASGPIYVPPTFGVPCVITNWTILGIRPFFGNSIFIPKLLFSEREQRYLNFTEILSNSIGYVNEATKFLASMGIKVIDNTPEEIKELVMEMLDGLDGKFNCSAEDLNLQKKFNILTETYQSYGLAPIGQSFLRKYAQLLSN